MPFDQTAWANLLFSHNTGNVHHFNVLFAEFIERIAADEEKYQVAVSLLESYFYGGHRSAVFESVCALRRMHPDSPKINAMLLGAAFETGRWAAVISVMHRNLKEPAIREALIPILAVWWRILSDRAPDIFRELLCAAILKAGAANNSPDHLLVFAQVLSGINVPDSMVAKLIDVRYGARAIALIGYIYQEQYNWTKALEIWCKVAVMEPDFPGIEQLMARAIVNISGSFKNAVAILKDYADRPRLQQAIRTAQFHNFVLIKGLNATYRINPKVGSTAILSKIWTANGGGDTVDPGKLYDNTEILPRLHHEPIDRIEEIVHSPEWLRFSFVRHPIRRFSSAFLNKCTRLHISVGGYAPFLRAIGLHAGIPMFAPIETRDDYRIEDVVEFTGSRAPQDLDRHFAPQTCVLNTAEIGYGFIGRMESFHQDLAKVSELVGADLTVSHESLHSTDSERFTKESLTGPMGERIADYFKSDMAEFGYS